MVNKPAPLAGTERQVLEALWDLGPATVRQVHDALRGRRRWAYTTVQTLLARLEAKGYVEIDRSGFAHSFRAVVSREELLRQRLEDLADELCQGAKTPLVLALVDGQGLAPKDFERLRALLARLDEAEKPKERNAGDG